MKTFTIPPQYPTNLYKIYEDNGKNFDDQKILYNPHKGDSSYIELNRLVNNFCANVGLLNIKSRDVAALFVSNGMNRIAAIIALMKLNIPIIFLDPILPKVKIEYLLLHANVKVVLVDDTHGLNKLWQTYEIKDVPMHDINDLLIPSNDDLDACNWSNFETALSSDIFCILATSGSTGNSKLVPLTHLNMICRLEWQWSAFPRGYDDVFCSKSSAISIDYILETLLAILKGHKCLFLQRCDVIEIPKFLTLLSSYHVTRLTTVPSQLQMLIAERNKNNTQPPSYLKQVAIGSALCESSLIRSCLKAFPGTVFWNMYGLTETTADITFAPFTSEADLIPGCDIAPIGFPVPNMDVFLVDENDQEINEINIVGEICITGLAVFPGYIKIGQEKEILLTNSDGVIILKSGDIGYWTKDHGLVSLGRRDQTVKVKGYKVNLNEIDISIRKLYPDVDVCVITKYNEIFSTDQCYAFCSFPDADNSITSIDVMSELKTLIPLYMLPRVIIVPEIPRMSSSGKVDREKMATMVDFFKNTRQKLRREEIAALPRTEQIAQILSDILDFPLTSSDMDKTFFDVGGDSLAIVHFFQRMNELGFAVSVSQIMQATSLKSLVDDCVMDLQRKDEFDLISFDNLTESELEKITSGFIEASRNEPLSRYCAKHYEESCAEYMRAAVTIAHQQYPEYSIAMKHHGKIVGASLNVPSDKENKMYIMENLNTKLPQSMRSLYLSIAASSEMHLYDQGMKVLEQKMIYVDPSVNNNTRTSVTIEICKTNVGIAKNWSFDAIELFTANRAATMIHVDLLGFKIESEITPKYFQSENGEKPFAEMNEDFKIVKMTKIFK